MGTQALSSNQPVAKARSQIFASMIDNSTITPDLESNEHEEDLEKSNIQLQVRTLSHLNIYTYIECLPRKLIFF